MVHTLPPWTTKYRMATIFGQIDSGELAARLGSVNIFNRAGNIIFTDDFENINSAWGEVGSGTGSSLNIVSEFQLMGAQCFKLIAGSDSGLSARIRRYFALPTDTRLGTEWAFTIDGDTDYIRFLNIYYDGTNSWQAVVKLDVTNSRILVDDETVGDVAIATGLKIYTAISLYNHLKFVVDFTTHKYVRVIFNNTTYDASSYDLDSGVSDRELNMYVEFKNHGNSGTNSVSYVDNCILTQNEP